MTDDERERLERERMERKVEESLSQAEAAVRQMEVRRCEARDRAIDEHVARMKDERYVRLDARITFLEEEIARRLMVVGISVDRRSERRIPEIAFDHLLDLEVRLAKVELQLQVLDRTGLWPS